MRALTQWTASHHRRSEISCDDLVQLSFVDYVVALLWNTLTVIIYVCVFEIGYTIPIVTEGTFCSKPVL